MVQPDPERQRVITLSVDVFLTIAVVALLAWLSLRIVAPFASILIWAVILAVALDPAFRWLKARLGSGGRAATAIALAGLALVLGPMIAVADSAIGTLGALAAHVSDGTLSVPPPPEEVRNWPLVGERLHAAWARASENLGAFSAQYAGEIRRYSATLLGAGTGLLVGMLQFALSVIFAAVILAWGQELSALTGRLAGRLTAKGAALVDMAGRTVRNVSRGVVGVALIQAGAGAVGIFAMGLPFAGLLSGVLLVACLVQFPPLAILPLIGLGWATDTATAATVFTIYMLLVMFINNVLQPVLMARGLTTPMPVILIGVIGGTLSGGLLGLFTGPVILAIFYDLVTVWMRPAEPAQAAEDA